MLDSVLRYALQAMSSVLPTFGDFSFAGHVAYGFDVSWELILIRSLAAFGFLLPVFVAAFFFLKTREVAR
jgi:hypothetical protein